MNPVLLTGATGFIGQRLQQTFLARDIPVVAVIRPGSAHKKNVVPGSTQCLFADLSDSALLAPVVAKVAAVIYCAGSVRGRSLEDFNEANIAGVRSIVSLMNQAATDTPLLLISSLAASRPHVSDYANSKYLGEQEVYQHARFPWSIFRPPAVYGPGDKEMLPILKMARKGLVTPTGPSGQRLSLIHVEDLATAVADWLQSWKKCVNQVYTLDDGHPGGYDWDEIAQAASGGRYRRVNIPAWIVTGAGHINLAVSRLLGYSPMLTPGKARELTQTDWLCNNMALSTAIGWSPQITLETGTRMLFGNPGNRTGK
jgi:nucleoside-diphosphate-sugar epimerase